MKKLLGGWGSQRGWGRRAHKPAAPPVDPRTLPNGVQNEAGIQRVSDDYTVVAGNVAGVNTRTSYVQANIPFTVFPLPPVAAVTAIQGTFAIEGWTEIAYGTSGSYVANRFATRIVTTESTLVFNLPLGTTLDQAKALLAGLVLRYQLATPINT